MMTLMEFSARQEVLVRQTAARLFLLCGLRGEIDLLTAAERYLAAVQENIFLRAVSPEELVSEMMNPGTFTNGGER